MKRYKASTWLGGIFVGLLTLGAFLACAWGVSFVFDVSYYKGLVGWTLCSLLALAVGGRSEK